MKRTMHIVIALVMLLAISSTALAEDIVVPSGAGTSVVYGPLYAYAGPGDSAWGTVGVDSVATWKHGSWPLISGSGAQWISNTQYITGNIAANSWRKFTTTKDLCSGAYNVSVSVNANADNAEEVYVNGVKIGGDGEVQGTFTDNQEWNTPKTYTSSTLVTDQVIVDFIVRNYSGTNSATGNPTGLIYEITINYSCPVEVDVDIKPGSDPSCFNNDGSGIIPVAINGSAAFDVASVNASTVTLEGLAVAVKGKSDKLMAAYEDWNLDGYMDLVLKMVDTDNTFSKGSGTAMIKGSLMDGTPIFGTGDICITQ